MAELPLAQGIDRFKQNEDRMDRFVNGSDSQNFVTSGGQNVPSIRKFLKDKDTEINEAADGLFAQTEGVLEDITEVKDRAVLAETNAANSANEANDFVAKAQEWAESDTAPGGGTTKSAKKWAEVAEAAVVRNNWRVDGPFVGTGVEATYALSFDPGTAANMLPVVAGVVQLLTDLAYDLVYSGGNPFIKITVPAGVKFEVRYGNAITVAIGTPTDGAVTTPKIADGAVTPAKMQSIPTNTILGRTAAGTGPIQALTPAQVQALFGIPVAGYISPGFNLSNNAVDAANDLDFPSGVVASEVSNPILMPHVAGTVQLDVAYGTGNGGRFDSAISDGWWHCFIISDGMTVSRGFSKSLNPTSQPNYPAGFTHYRRVASWRRTSGALLALIQDEDDFDYVTDITDRNSPSLLTSSLFTVSVPVGFPVKPKMAIVQGMSTAGNCQTQMASAGKTPRSVVITTGASDADCAFVTHVKTNTFGQIQLAVTSTGGSLSFAAVTTTGWTDRRGR